MNCNECGHVLSRHDEKTKRCGILVRSPDGLSWKQCSCGLEKTVKKIMKGVGHEDECSDS